jgi:hypothetical protein
LHTELVFTVDGKSEAQRVPADGDVDAALRAALAAGKHVVSVTPRTESLEDYFVREVDTADVGGGAERVKLKGPGA